MVLPEAMFSAKLTVLLARPGALSNAATWMVMVLGVEKAPLWSCTEKLKLLLPLALAAGV